MQFDLWFLQTSEAYSRHMACNFLKILMRLFVLVFATSDLHVTISHPYCCLLSNFHLILIVFREVGTVLPLIYRRGFQITVFCP